MSLSSTFKPGEVVPASWYNEVARRLNHMIGINCAVFYNPGALVLTDGGGSSGSHVLHDSFAAGEEVPASWYNHVARLITHLVTISPMQVAYSRDRIRIFRSEDEQSTPYRGRLKSWFTPHEPVPASWYNEVAALLTRIEGTPPVAVSVTPGAIVISVSPQVEEGVNLSAAILERQKAWGMTDPWDSEDPANPANWIDLGTTYTLDEYKAYVNYFSGGYLAEPHSTGATPPVMHPWDYADSATTEAELYTLVCALTICSCDYYNPDQEDCAYYRGSASDADYATAKAAAEAAFAAQADNSSSGYASASASYNGTVYTCIVSALGGKRSVVVWDGLPHRIHWGFQIQAQGTFSKQGQDVADENYYWYPQTSDWTSDATVNSDVFLDASILPTNWPSAPGNGENLSSGFQLDGDSLWTLIEWQFEHTA